MRVRKVMGSPTSGCCCADVDDWVRILLDNNSGFVGDDRESNDMCADNSEEVEDSSPRRDAPCVV